MLVVIMIIIYEIFKGQIHLKSNAQGALVKKENGQKRGHIKTSVLSTKERMQDRTYKIQSVLC